MLYSCVREYSVRRYLDGFSDAIVPNALPAEQKVAAILNWMRAEPLRANTTNPEALAKRDPQMTLTYRQLLNVCGTATNAFLNLARSSDRGTLDHRRSNLPGHHEGCTGPLFDAQRAAESCRVFRGRRRHPELSAGVLLRPVRTCASGPPAS